MALQDENRIRALVLRYQQSLFSLVVTLVGGDRDKAYAVAVSSFVKTIQNTSAVEKESRFFIDLLSRGIQESREMKTVPSSDVSDFGDQPLGKIKALQIMKTALVELPFELRVPLVLRDQLHLPYSLMAAILRIPERSARIQTVQSRLKLRGKIEETLRKAM